MPGRDELHWAPRVSQAKIRRLYQSDATGLLDEELLDDVGTRLYQRCRSILDVEEARQGRVRCPVCDRAGRETIIHHPIVRDPLQVVLTCPVCGWSIQWHDYLHSIKRQQLNSGGAFSTFTGYLRNWNASRTPEQKMVAIDRLIHAFHYSFAAHPNMPTRPAGVNVIKGRLTDVIAFLNELAYGPGSTLAAVETRQQWEQTLTIWRDFMDSFQNEEEA